ncbi:hypothetical protein [Chitinophaga sp. Cy-1792]|uniref:hypothetical protein n=1 Tax=Chitinophaga sp. Cy-1792 TaxID=2608339 RepID=UPI0014237DEE|nr:hypothetical protein [Chitinophaga sp. Cy-1792]NIG54523.1 hypothetical protein [Chitinophaga sp. Cy-1792]
MNVVIAKRSTQREVSSGHITPIYFISEDNLIESTGSAEKRKEKFPNLGTIIILKEYNYVYEDFEAHEFFVLDIEETSNYEEYTPTSCQYQSLDGTSVSISKLPMLIKGKFPLDNDQIGLPYSGHRYVFIEDGGFIYGPISIFQVEKPDQMSGDFIYKIESLNTVDLNLNDELQNVTFKFNREQLEHRIVKNLYGKNEDEEYYIYGISEIVEKIQPIEHILNETDQQIIDWASTAFPDGYSKEKTQNWLTMNSGESVVDKIRFSRLTSLQGKTSAWLNYLDAYISNQYIQSKEGQAKIDQYISNNKFDLIKDYEAQFRKEFISKNKELGEDISNLEKTIVQRTKDVEGLEASLQRLTNQKELLQSKSEELNKIEQEIASKLEVLGMANNLPDLSREYTRVENAVHVLMTSVDQKKKELLELQEEYFKEATKGTHKKVVELMPYVKALNGYFPDTLQQDEMQASSFDFDTRIISGPLDMDLYISEAKTYLDSRNRILSEIEIANVLTCVHQNFLTIFSGLPGVGKSSLSYLIGSFIAPKDLYLDIPVGRGWNSKKNLLGFYNSLKAEYQKDEFGLLDRLYQLTNDPELLRTVPFFIVLDEANLSPIEHYWSDFLGVTDKETDRSIHLNDPKQDGYISLPDGLRFLFTINNDHTTEILSPRLLDRASIIKLDYDAQKSTELTFTALTIDHDMSYHSFASIRSAFFPENPSLTQNEKRTFTEILNILGDKDAKLGKQVPVSPRKVKAITMYCHVVRKIFNKYHSNQFLALDYAILQNIIPLINGHGKGFEARLQKLKDECFHRSLLKSGQELDEIITKGKEFQNYTFF